MKGYTIRTSNIKTIDDCYNNVWDYRFIRYHMTDGTMIDVPYNCTCKPILREFKDGTLVNFEDLSSVVII